MRYLAYNSTNPPGILSKVVAVIGTVVVAGLALMFSAVLMAVIVIAGVIAWTYVWWKTREVRKHMDQQMKDFSSRASNEKKDVFREEVFEGEIIEGEVIRADDSKNRRGF